MKNPVGPVGGSTKSSKAPLYPKSSWRGWIAVGAEELWGLVACVYVGPPRSKAHRQPGLGPAPAPSFLGSARGTPSGN
jgi:hypothetical protein